MRKLLKINQTLRNRRKKSQTKMKKISKNKKKLREKK